MDFEKEVEEIKYTLKILDNKVGEITRSIRAYVDYQTESRVEEGLEELQQRIERRLSSLESRIKTLERNGQGESTP